MGIIAVAGIGVVGLSSAPSGAQVAGPRPTPVSAAPLDVTNAAAGDRSLSLSDDGAIVAYDTGSATAANRVVVRDRTLGTTLLDVAGSRPALSADGCSVAFTTRNDAAGVITSTLSVHDLCTATPVRTVATVDGAVNAAPALSADGAVVIWSAGGTIARYVDAGSGFAVDPGFAPSIAAGSVPGPNVDASSDGSSVAFEVLPVGGAPAQTTVWVWADATASAVRIGGNGSHRPTISGDGRLVVFESSDVGLAGAAPAPAVPFVVAYDRSRSTATVVSGAAWRPAITTDGNNVEYRRAG
jgi:hypothetical protein